MTIAPPRRSIIPGSTARMQRKALVSVPSMSRRHDSSSIVTRLSPIAESVLFTSTSTRPAERALDVGATVTSATTASTAVPRGAAGARGAPGVDVDAAHARALLGEASHERAADAAPATRDRYGLALRSACGDPRTRA